MTDTRVDLAAGVLAGDRAGVARALSLVERGGAPAEALIAAIFSRTGRAHLVGFTGGAGVGKSTLLAALAAEWCRRGRSVGIVAVDPSSAVTGGALLGDRVRMESLNGDPRVFVRSMAARGAAGGLARATRDAARVLDAAGFDVVAIETIGAGQDEVEIASVAETVVVVEAPNLGDDVQALKAGLLEIADLIVVNKGDQPGAERAASVLEGTLALGAPRDRPIPVLLASATDQTGIGELIDALDQHSGWLEEGHRRAARARRRAKAEIEQLLRDELLRRALAESSDPDLSQTAQAVADRAVDPYAATRRILTDQRRRETSRQP